MQKVTISPAGLNATYTDRETNPFYCEWAGFVFHDEKIKNPVVLRIYKNPKKYDKVSAWLWVYGGIGKYKDMHNVSSLSVSGGEAETKCLNKVFLFCGVELENPIQEFLSLHTQLQDIIAAILSELYPDCQQFIHQAHA